MYCDRCVCCGRTVRQIGGVTLNAVVSELKGREVGPRAANRKTRRVGNVQSDCELMSLLSYLEADNKKLWQAVLVLSIETATLRQALKAAESRRRAADAKPRTQRRQRFPFAAAAQKDLLPNDR